VVSVVPKTSLNPSLDFRGYQAFVLDMIEKRRGDQERKNGYKDLVKNDVFT
jgi:hypothetical protein